MIRLWPLAFLWSCGGDGSATFEEAVVTASYEFDRCWTGQYRPREEFTYSESAALSACRACWLGERPPRIHCSRELEDACDEVLSYDDCGCVWGTQAVNMESCRQCLTEECGVDAIDDDAAVCAIAQCENAQDRCSFTADCTIR